MQIEVRDITYHLPNGGGRVKNIDFLAKNEAYCAHLSFFRKPCVKKK